MRSQKGGQMQLTILSAEAIKSQLGNKLDISVSCNISELPNYHCTIIFSIKGSRYRSNRVSEI